MNLIFICVSEPDVCVQIGSVRFAKVLIVEPGHSGGWKSMCLSLKKCHFGL